MRTNLWSQPWPHSLPVPSRQEEDDATMVMGDEEYDEPDQLLAGLPERVLLSDFVESQEPETNAIAEARCGCLLECFACTD